MRAPPDRITRLSNALFENMLSVSSNVIGNVIFTAPQKIVSRDRSNQPTAFSKCHSQSL